MADNVRTLFTDPVAESGAGTALFDIFKQNQELEQYAKKKDIDTSAAMKLNAQQNEFTTGLEALRSKFHMAEADNASQIAMRDLTMKGTALAELTARNAQQLSQQTGQGIPGLTYQGAPETPDQSTGEAAIPFQSSPISPLAAPEAAKTFESAFSSELRKNETKSQISFQAERDAMRDKLGLTTQAHADAAKNLKATLEALDPQNVNIPLLDTFLEPGQAHQSDFARIVPQIAMQVEKAKASLNQTKALEAARLARMKEIHGMDNASKEAIAKLRGDAAQANQAMTQLRKLQAGYSAHYQTLRDSANRLSMQLNAGMLSGPGEVQARAELAQTEEAIQQVQASIEGVNQAMMGFMTQTKPTPPSPMEQANIKKRIGSTLLKEKGIDPAKMTDAQRTEMTAEAERRFQEYMRKNNQPYNATK